MEFGREGRETATDEVSHKMVSVFLEQGFEELDTALLYGGGETERILGRMSEDLTKRSLISTKVNPWYDEFKSLTAESIYKQCALSFEALKTEAVDILYLHAPDHNTPIEESLEAMNKLHVEGKFKRLGLSNYSAWQVVKIYHICKANGWILPTVYQVSTFFLFSALLSTLAVSFTSLALQCVLYSPHYKSMEN